MRVLIAKRDIKAGEIIGFSYSEAYWIAARKYPEYFTVNGTIVNRSEYKRKKVTIFVTHPNNKQTLELGVFPDIVLQSEAANLPAQITIENKEIQLSAYELRNKLAEANALDQRYAKLNGVVFSEQLFDSLKNKFPDIKVEAYFRFPGESSQSPRGQAYDVVCRVSNQKQFPALKKLFKKIDDEVLITIFPETNEITIIGTNVQSVQSLLKNFLYTLGKDAPELYSKGVFLFQQGKYIEATRLMLEASEFYEKDSKELATCFYSLASCYLRQEQYEKALEFAKQARDLRVALIKNGSVNETDLKRAETKLADATNLLKADKIAQIGFECIKQKKYDEAHTYYQKAIQIHCPIQSDSAKLAIYYHNLALSFSGLGNLEEAKQYYNLALDIRLKLFGPDNVLSKETQDKIKELGENVNSSDNQNTNLPEANL